MNSTNWPCTDIRRGHGFEYRWSPDFFRLLLSDCLNWKINCDGHSSLPHIYNPNILSLWLVPTNLIEDRRTIDIINAKFFPLCFKMAQSFENLDNIYMTGGKMTSKKRHVKGLNIYEKEQENDWEQTLEKSRSAVKQDLTQTQNWYSNLVSTLRQETIVLCHWFVLKNQNIAFYNKHTTLLSNANFPVQFRALQWTKYCLLQLMANCVTVLRCS